MPQLTGFDYVKSWAGLFKLGEFLTLLIAFSCLGDFAERSDTNGSFKYFFFVTVTAWIVTIILFFMYFFGIQQRISVNWSLVMTIYSMIVSFLLLVAASIVADKARKYRRGAIRYRGEYVDTCDHYDQHGSPCRNVEAAVAFAFMALMLFLLDTFFYFMECRSSGPSGDSGFVQHEDIDTQQENN
ncbi:uncharacterized protein LOC124437548 [Xenia sp. Carnegie-2017]|uniref:uncharacterized protein LOC124437548 n=1 Tax=Xenia sp. Carnegie-2017 TaxID=2897299 RepID=UPI001F03D334|nr:uncharacterized protein LOC124437548 [Xenia sp. Carnegie-2017]XP_046843468.1 uncharacterized protein LOC124437548 [Xenia sp. Carnegie-2017]